MLANELQLQAARSPSFATQYEALHREHRQALGQLIGVLFRKAGKKPRAKVEDLAATFLALFHGLALQRMPGVDNPKAISAGTLVILILESP